MSKIRFEKYQGNGNDFILIDSRSSNLKEEIISSEKVSISQLCDRNFGIGADGVIFIDNPIQNNDARMVIFNSDNTEAEMCGNGIRCLIEYLHQKQEKTKTVYNIETKAGLKVAQYKNGNITVKMGCPILNAKDIPTTITDLKLGIPTKRFKADNFESIGYAIGMGNPHLIFFIEDINSVDHRLIGPLLENNIYFPEKTNIHFCQILDRDNIKIKVWERGAGSTLACGTGACSVHVAAFKLGLCNSSTSIHLPGGCLSIEWSKEEEQVKMTGYSEKTFEGVYELNL